MPRDRRILLADADAFFVAVARTVDPEGAGKAPLLIVGGSRESRGVVCSASYETRKFGVRSAMPIARALRLCPDAMCVPVPRKACSAKSAEIRRVLERFAPVVEGASIDEWYMDLGGTEGVYHHEPLATTAHRMRDAVRRETGLTISIGGGTNKLVAKLAVERAKPKPASGADGVHVVPAGTEEAFLRTFRLADIPMVGPKFQERLGALGMTAVPDVLAYDLPTLKRYLGEREAQWLWDRVHGIDESEVASGGEARSISRDETFPADISSDDELHHELLALVTRAAFDLRSDGLTARTVTVRLRDMDFRNRSAQRTLPRPVVSDRVILRAARELLAKLRAQRRVPARLLGVALSSLAQDPRADQLALFADARDPLVETDRDRALARTVDRVREKFGDKGILPASLTRIVSVVFALLALGCAGPPVSTGSAPNELTSRDSALVRRILLAEDLRNEGDAAFAEGLRHRDPRVRLLARRAAARTRDPRFDSRDSFPSLPPPPAWPEPAWRLRYRALAAHRENCDSLRVALTDSVWPVRLRAADLVTARCAGDDSLAAIVRGWVDSLPANVAVRRPGRVSWHGAGHGLVALARLRPDARARIQRISLHPQWHLRVYAARAAAAAADTTTLRRLARDRHDNVKEAAIEALAGLTGHADDELYLEALTGPDAPAVRAAALALKGSPRSDVRGALDATYDRWRARASDSERDVRTALLEAAGRPAGDDRLPRVRVIGALPNSSDGLWPDPAIQMALGQEVRLRVTMAPASGGGSFTVRLRGDVAPIKAARVLQLTRDGYYDRTRWHRVEHDFVIQGLGPGDNEYVGFPRYFRDELGTVPHARGTVGMSTRGHDTGDAQWFVNLRDNLRLGRDYTVFAEVIDGIEVVDGIMEGDEVLRVERVDAARADARLPQPHVTRVRLALGHLAGVRDSALRAHRPDSGTARADSAFRRFRASFGRLVEEATKPLADPAFEKAIYPGGRGYQRQRRRMGGSPSAVVPDAEIARADSLFRLVRAHGVLPVRAEGGVYYQPDESWLLAVFAPLLTDAGREAWRLRAVEQASPTRGDGAIQIGVNELAERVAGTDRFGLMHPRAADADDIRRMHRWYLWTYLAGWDNTPAFDRRTGGLRTELRDSYERYVAVHATLESAVTVRRYLDLLRSGGYARNDAIDAFLRQLAPAAR